MSKSTSSLWQKIGASAVNCTVVLLLTSPLYPFISADVWKIATIAIFFIYNVCFRSRCLGMRVVGTFIEPPGSIWYAALYTAGFTTFFYSVWFPMDLLIANGIAQVGSLAMTGNTLHGNFAGQGTMSRETYLERCKERARECWRRGELRQAVTSMLSDLDRYPETKPAPLVRDLGIIVATHNDVSGVRSWIEGFE